MQNLPGISVSGSDSVPAIVPPLTVRMEHPDARTPPTPSASPHSITPENSCLLSSVSASPESSQKIQSVPPTALPAGSRSATPPRCLPARCTATATHQRPPTTSCTAWPDSPDSPASTQLLARAKVSPDTSRHQTSVPPAAAGPSVSPTAPVSPPTAPSNTSVLLPVPPLPAISAATSQSPHTAPPAPSAGSPVPPGMPRTKLQTPD